MTQVSMHVLVIDRGDEPLDLLANVSRSAVGAFQQERLEPAIELFNRTVIVRSAFRNEEDLTLQAQTKTDDPAE